MRLAFHQPNYLPNLSFFYKMLNVDIFVIPTRLQFVRREWHNRAKIKGPHGDLMLSIPVAGSNRQALGDAKFEGSNKWMLKHRRTLEMCYAKDDNANQLQEILKSFNDEPDTDKLTDFTVNLILTLRDLLNIDTQIVVDDEVTGKKHELLINLCEKYSANEYLSGLGGKHYMDDDYVHHIRSAGIDHYFVEHNVTAQYPYSAVHYICREGLEYAQTAIR